MTDEKCVHIIILPYNGYVGVGWGHHGGRSAPEVEAKCIVLRTFTHSNGGLVLWMEQSVATKVGEEKRGGSLPRAQPNAATA